MFYEPVDYGFLLSVWLSLIPRTRLDKGGQGPGPEWGSEEASEGSLKVKVLVSQSCPLFATPWTVAC